MDRATWAWHAGCDCHPPIIDERTAEYAFGIHRVRDEMLTRRAREAARVLDAAVAIVAAAKAAREGGR
jgi:hypothetical protein